MRLKYKFSLILIVSISITALIESVSSYTMQRKIIDAVMYDEAVLIGHQFEQSLIATQQKTTTISEFITTLPSVKQAFAEQNRDQLIEVLLPAYQILHDKHGYSQAQFHIPPSTSFLRLHDITKYGDDLSMMRETVLEANHNQQIYHGIESGISGVSIRSVVPMTYKDEHIGTFELGLQLNEILDNLKDSSDVESGIFMDVNLLNKSLGQEHKLNEDPFFGSFKLINTTKPKLMQVLASESELIRVKDKQFYTQNIRNFEFSVISMPLRDFSNRKIGVVILAKDFSYYHDLANISLVRTMSITLLGIILVATILLILESYFLYNPLSILANSQNKLEFEQFAKRKDEIGAISRKLLDK
ncbi:cache domain-containing protein [Candidatus Albibeggiatoa sp. nov. BB20]|uniref:cache domain-containing protein n=1 Tax=Candidatus Albibeggiatoa sp. nov. BB20 TaxID=3162723 RepID=UPI003365AFD4